MINIYVELAMVISSYKNKNDYSIFKLTISFYIYKVEDIFPLSTLKRPLDKDFLS